MVSSKLLQNLFGKDVNQLHANLFIFLVRETICYQTLLLDLLCRIHLEKSTQHVQCGASLEDDADKRLLAPMVRRRKS